MKWINLDANIKTYLRKYYNTIIPICKVASVQPPWDTFDDFEHKVFSYGFVALVIWIIFSFSTFIDIPGLTQRLAFAIHKAFLYNPNFFD